MVVCRKILFSKEKQMKRRIMNAGFAIVLVAGGYFWGHQSSTIAHAQVAVAIPKAWGHVVGAFQGAVVLEDAAGTVRFVDEGTGRPDVVISRN